MRAYGLILATLLLVVPNVARAVDSAPGVDTRYPVPVTSGDAVEQKTEMRGNLVALRDTLTALAARDFIAVEKSLRQLVHTGPVTERPGASTQVFRDLEAQFEASVDKTVAAARSGNVDVVLRSLSDTMAYCQSCHMAFREALDTKAPAEPDKSH
jgi:hypothetical protein